MAGTKDLAKSMGFHAVAMMPDGHSLRFANIASVALRKLDYLNAAAVLADLCVPPRNRLEILRGHREGQHSVRVNDQWRICFVWTDAGPADVEIYDYH
jgi:proteic killer suppression protein